MNKPPAMEKVLLSNGTSPFIIPSIIVRPSTGTGTLASRGSKFLINLNSLFTRMFERKKWPCLAKKSPTGGHCFPGCRSHFFEKKTFLSPFDLAFRFERNLDLAFRLECVPQRLNSGDESRSMKKTPNFGYVCSENKLQKEALFYFLILGISKRYSWLSPQHHFS